MYIACTSWGIPASSGDIDMTVVMAQIASIVSSNDDVVAVCKFDGSAVSSIAKNGSSLQSSVQSIMTAAVNGSTQTMMMWSYSISSSDNVFLFYKVS
tara:strand:+ start:573 stop:863 length:291 start_codon:yes stop_codon:yes gene_type:complete